MHLERRYHDEDEAMLAHIARQVAKRRDSLPQYELEREHEIRRQEIKHIEEIVDNCGGLKKPVMRKRKQAEFRSIAAVAIEAAELMGLNIAIDSENGTHGVIKIETEKCFLPAVVPCR